MILKIINFWPILKFFFIPRSLKTARNNRSYISKGKLAVPKVGL
jgi:hypothetical protein